MLMTETSTKPTKAPVKPKRSHSVKGEKIQTHTPTANYENVFLDVYRGNFSVYKTPSLPPELASDTSDIPFIDASKEDISHFDREDGDNMNKNNNITSSVEHSKVMYEDNCDKILENTTDIPIQEEFSTNPTSNS